VSGSKSASRKGGIAAAAAAANIEAAAAAMERLCSRRSGVGGPLPLAPAAAEWATEPEPIDMTPLVSGAAATATGSPEA
jgi:hypothetical protein